MVVFFAFFPVQLKSKGREPKEPGHKPPPPRRNSEIIYDDPEL